MAAEVKPSVWGRRVKRVLRWLLLLVLVASGLAVADGWTAFGHRATGARRARMEKSPQWKDGHFENPQSLENDAWGSITGIFGASPYGRPTEPLAVVTVDPRRFDTPPTSGLRVTWFGHSSMLIEIDGHRVLTDPVWSQRIGPLSWVGPTRWYGPLLALEALPHVDAVVISHDHYDHLDYRTLVAMKGWDTRFIVPLGVGAHLAYWGIPEERIIEMDWWERTKVGDLEIVCTPARHASGRTAFDKDATLWAGYALNGKTHRAYFSGDTGLFPAMKDIGARLGPFDLTMIETGQYGAAWPDWHIGPEQAVTAHRLVRGRVMLPVHWALLQLAFHGWTEPIERVLAAGARGKATLVTPRPGQSLEQLDDGVALPVERWWPEVPWKTAKEAPIVSTKVPREVLESL